MKSIPRVSLVGRLNVGKSTLFNCLSESVKTIAADFEGVTRDFVRDKCCWLGKCFELVDLGGISWRKMEDPLQEQVRKVAIRLLKSSDVIIFVCDGKVGLTDADREIGRFLHKLGIPIIVAVNKIDTKIAKENAAEFWQLGFEDLINVSAEHGIGTADLLEMVVEKLPKRGGAGKKTEGEAGFKVAIIGRPNVGKSSLMNLLVGEERSIISEIAGTTRERVKQDITFYKENLTLTDTPGLRRKKSIRAGLEPKMVGEALEAIREADIVLLVVDSAEDPLCDQEVKLAFQALDAGKSLIIVFNKFDLVTDNDLAIINAKFEEYGHLFNVAAFTSVSCKTGKNIGKLLPMIRNVRERGMQRFDNEEVTTLIKSAFQAKPVYKGGQKITIKRMAQIKVAPPTFLVFVKVRDILIDAHLAFMQRVLREKYDLSGVPVKFVVREGV